MSLDNIYNFAWLPWLNFYSEVALLQCLIILSVYLFVSSTNLYYSSIYMLLTIFFMGIFLAFYNLEVLTGFLFIIELTAFFVLILFLLTLNFEGQSINKTYNFCNFSLVLLGLYLLFLYGYTRHPELTVLNLTQCWEDYYEALSNDTMNDIAGLYLSYYGFNSPLFFIFALLIFIATLVCINLLKSARIYSQQGVVSSQYIFNFFKDLVGFDFLRKQNMDHQNKQKPATRFVRFKKKQNVAKE